MKPAKGYGRVLCKYVAGRINDTVHYGEKGKETCSCGEVKQ